MLHEPSARALTYEALDDVLSGTAASRARATMFRVVDQLRAYPEHIEDVRRAEMISVEIHKLEWALLRSDSLAAAAAREQLKELAAALLSSRIGQGPAIVRPAP